MAKSILTVGTRSVCLISMQTTTWP